ncbi:multifunctional aminopeptidase A [Fictibacillus macauensis ZFHKF-1]|uniref:Probable cytosol aminopeptidase n=1 Tax=Fictibacillus macauensis ZFHKF-1 TaxID=1196324 RepID=I8AIR5_9BACL|nr:leucyl aminopeptidase [Fictibacillus macauensis]EIT85632.1 multifunctional aminopeptidase A [Fictibacillus macauensis ZFHKF-1]
MFTTKVDWQRANHDEALIIGVWSDRKKLEGYVKEIDEAFNGHITQLFKEGDISTSYKALSKLHTFGIIGAKRLYFIGLGRKQDSSYERIRAALGKVVKEIDRDQRESVSILLDTFTTENVAIEQMAHAFSEAILSASYTIQHYKERSNQRDVWLKAVTVYTKEEVNRALQEGAVFGAGLNTARTLVNTPANLLTPSDLIGTAVELAISSDMEYEVLERADMEKLGMGALLAVSQGSVEPPKLFVAKYTGGEKDAPYLALVGKGVTFDAGGYSIKTATGMVDMKSDMGGAAAVIGALEVIGKLRPQTNLLFVIPACENLINGAAMKPGDVITSLSGLTIEVKNTDAEGRLLLADAVTYAKQLGAHAVVDVATLTGGVSVALGDCTTGAVTNDETLYHQLKQVAAHEGELLWLLPSHQPFKDMIRTSDVADLTNSSGRLGHAITGGLFIGTFAGETPWVHLDIAGTAFSARPSDLGPKGATGVMVRTLARLAMQWQAE